MPAKSKSMQRAAGMAYGAKKAGKTPPGNGPAASMAKSMSKSQLKDFASTPTAKLPNKVAPGKGMNSKPAPKGRCVSE